MGDFVVPGPSQSDSDYRIESSELDDESSSDSTNCTSSASDEEDTNESVVDSDVVENTSSDEAIENDNYERIQDIGIALNNLTYLPG
jgi:hypothetical protein